MPTASLALHSVCQRKCLTELIPIFDSFYFRDKYVIRCPLPRSLTKNHHFHFFIFEYCQNWLFSREKVTDGQTDKSKTKERPMSTSHRCQAGLIQRKSTVNPRLKKRRSLSTESPEQFVRANSAKDVIKTTLLFQP